jgi:hypothetical protein
MKHGRKTPYTEIGIKRLPCFRCGVKPSYSQWQVCADDNLYRPLCLKCDIELNRMVLKWMHDKCAGIKMSKYIADIEDG